MNIVMLHPPVLYYRIRLQGIVVRAGTNPCIYHPPTIAAVADAVMRVLWSFSPLHYNQVKVNRLTKGPVEPTT